MACRLWALLITLLSAHVSSEDLVEEFPEAAIRAHIAIIIDDLGYGLKPAQAILSIPHDLTMAIIPFTPYGSEVAQRANKRGKEVMLHAPMETLNAAKWESGLTADMDQIELIASLDAMIADIPHVSGVNNHGGSKLTQDRNRMQWMMSLLLQKQLYFIDSRTVATSEAEQAAATLGLAYGRRDVFLDNEKSEARIQQQLEKLQSMALKNGSAIGIAHPYPETQQILQKKLPEMERSGIKIVRASQLLTYPKTPETPLIARTHPKPGE